MFNEPASRSGGASAIHRRRAISAALIPALAIVGSARLNAVPEFDPPLTLPVGDTPVFVAVADYNGDGLADLTVSNFFNLDISIFFGQGGGAFSGETFFVAADPQLFASPTIQTVGDFDGDGDPDIAVALGFRNALAVHLNIGDGSFAAPVTVALPGEASDLHARDVTGDGVLDIVVLHGEIDQISVLPGAGDGTFGAVITTPAERGTMLRLADVNADGFDDALQINIFSDVMTVRFGVGDGTFPLALFAPLPWSEGTIGLDVLDFNGDGDLDVALSNFFFGEATVALGDGMGGFAAGAPFVMGLGSAEIASGDFDNDGVADLIAAISEEAAVAVAGGLGDGTFTPAVTSKVGSTPRAVIVADLNGDGIDDAVVANSLDNSVTVLLSSVSTPADLNADGFVNGADLLVLLNDFGASGVPADINGSGTVDGVDLLFLLSAWTG